MPWWVIAYLALVALLSAGGLVDDVRDRRPWWYLATGLVSALVSVLLVLAYWLRELEDLPGVAVALLLVYAVAWDGWSARNDVVQARSDPEISGPTVRRGVWIAAFVMVPAYVFGLLAALGLRATS